MNTELGSRKARGAFFTPPEVADFLVHWAVQSPDNRVLEPSCGEAAFLESIAARLLDLGASNEGVARNLHGCDIHEGSIRAARERLAKLDLEANLEAGDFFDRPAQRLYDAVVGNPPYIRYQGFSGEARTKSLEAALAQGVRLTQLASSWAAFTVHASAFLKPEGRLAFVLPAELLSVKYAAQIRRFLLGRFKRVRLVLFDDLVFPGVLEDVVLLLAEGAGGADHFEVYQAKNAGDLIDKSPERWVGFQPKGDQKWTSALLPRTATALYERISNSSFETMSSWGRTYLGAVTGNNQYFTLTRTQVEKLGLSSSEVLRVSPPGSRHLQGLAFSDYAWQKQSGEGAACYLFAPGAELSEAAQKYINRGKRLGVDKAYKCRVRDPWWMVPLVPRPDLLFAYMSHDRPRLVRNSAGVQLLNSVYGVRLSEERKDIGERLLPMACLNSLTLLGAEIVGRSYGGGLLKHEPTEVGSLPVPSFEILKQASSKLELLESQIANLLRRRDITPATEIVDRVILGDCLGLSVSEIQEIREARNLLRNRRMTRGKSANGSS